MNPPTTLGKVGGLQMNPPPQNRSKFEQRKQQTKAKHLA